MNPDQLAANLLEAAGGELELLMDQASTVAECLTWLLNHASQSLASAPDLAIRSADLARQLASRQLNLHSAAIASRTYAQGLRSLGRHSEALDAFDEASAFARELNNSLLQAQVQIGAIDSLIWLGRHDEAVELSLRLLHELRRLDAHQDAARVLVNLGNGYYRQDRYHEALNCYEEAASALAQSGDAVAAATVDFNRANIYSELLESDRALALFTGAREVFSAKNLDSLVAMCDFNIGVLYQALGQYTAALAAQQRAIAQFAERNQSLEVAKCSADMGDLYRLLNLRVESLNAYDSAISEFERIPLDYERARAELGRAAILAAQGRAFDAGTALERAEVVFVRQRNRVQLAQARLLRAYWLRESGNLPAARAEARSASNTYSRLRLRARAAEARFLEAEIALDAGENAMRRMAAVRRAARTYSQGWLESRAERAMGSYCVAHGRNASALKHYRAGVETLEATRTMVPGEELHTAFISNKLAIYEDLVSLLVARGRPRDIEEALEYVERSKSRLLLERVQSALSDSMLHSAGQASESGGPVSLARLAELRGRLNRMYNEIHPEDIDGTKRLMVSPQEISGRLEEVEREYRTALRMAEVDCGPGLFSLLRVASPSQLQSWLSAGEVLVEYYVLHGTICAFVLSKTEPVRVVRDLATTAEIEHASRRLRYHLKRAGSVPDYVERHKAQFLSGVLLPLSTLFDILIRPLLTWLAGEKITVVPHGVLHGLPFHSFYDTERREYVLDRWEISYSPSATVRYMDNMSEHGNRPTGEQFESLVMGVPDAGLEQIAVEVADLAKVLTNARVFCGESATLMRFREFAGSSRLIHLATHALFRADNPLFSGLKFADGWLLARDLYSMRLNCDLVTLSACRTGQALVESGDEMFGLLRGFLAAGARTVAVSLWPAEDLPTARLMTRFHALMAQGKSRTASLRLAQKEVRLTWQHPYQWAAFALFGER